MGKKIRFPLKMDDGIEVRDMDSLRDNFSIPRVIGYLEDGKLITWLRDRYANDLADAIEALDKDDGSITKKLCEILEVEFDEEAEADFERMKVRNRKLESLKQFSLEKDYLDNVDAMAFDQDDLYALLDDGLDKIYLCGECFLIPIAQKGITYIGANNPMIVFDSKTEFDLEEKKILLIGVKVESKYQEIVDAMQSISEEKVLLNTVRNSSLNSKQSVYGKYIPNSYVNFLLSPSEKIDSEKSFELLVKEIGSIKYDIDNDIKDTMNMLVKTKIVNLAEKYLKKL